MYQPRFAPLDNVLLHFRLRLESMSNHGVALINCPSTIVPNGKELCLSSAAKNLKKKKKRKDFYLVACNLELR